MFHLSKKILRILFFVGLLVLPLIFGWWLFVPLSIFLVIFAGKAYEIIIAGGLLDSLYYFGNSFWQTHLLLIIGLLCALISLFLEKEVNWRKLL